MESFDLLCLAAFVVCVVLPTAIAILRAIQVLRPAFQLADLGCLVIYVASAMGISRLIDGDFGAKIPGLALGLCVAVGAWLWGLAMLAKEKVEHAMRRITFFLLYPVVAITWLAVLPLLIAVLVSSRESQRGPVTLQGALLLLGLLVDLVAAALSTWGVKWSLGGIRRHDLHTPFSVRQG